MAKNKKKKSNGGNGVHALSDEQFVRQRARQLPIGDCYMDDGIEQGGLTNIAVLRKHPQGKVTGAMFLVDTLCLGVKDAVVFVRKDMDELKENFLFFDEYNEDVRKISYEEAHNRIYGAIAFAEEAGIEPCKEFNLAQYILEEDTDDIPLIEYEYGKDGKHTLFAKNGIELSTYLPILREHLGDNFNYYCPTGYFNGNGLEETDDRYYEFFGNFEYPSTFKPKTKHLIKLLEGKDGEDGGVLQFKEIMKILGNRPELLYDDLCNFLAFMKGKAEEDYYTDEDENLEMSVVDDNPETYLIINALTLLSLIGFGDKRHIANDWFNSSTHILKKYFGNLLEKTEKFVYLSMAHADLDYVCELARDFGFWSEVSDCYLFESLATYGIFDTKAKPAVQKVLGDILDMAIACGRDEREEPVREHFSGSRVLEVAAIITVFNYKEMIPKVKEAFDALGIEESACTIFEDKDSEAITCIQKLNEEIANSDKSFLHFLFSIIADDGTAE